MSLSPRISLATSSQILEQHFPAAWDWLQVQISTRHVPIQVSFRQFPALRPISWAKELRILSPLFGRDNSCLISSASTRQPLSSCAPSRRFWLEGRCAHPISGVLRRRGNWATPSESRYRARLHNKPGSNRHLRVTTTVKWEASELRAPSGLGALLVIH